MGKSELPGDGTLNEIKQLLKFKILRMKPPLWYAVFLKNIGY